MYFKIKNLILENPKVLKSCNIVHIADIHYSRKTTEQKLARIGRKIKKLSPAYLCITGDSIDHTKEMYHKDKMVIFKNWLQFLASDIPIIMSIGNHDFSEEKDIDIQYEFWNSIKRLHRDIHLLHNELYEDKKLTFMGLTQEKKYYSKTQENKDAMLGQLKTHKNLLVPISGKLAIALIHSPLCLMDSDISEELSNFQIILSGHTHNGVVPPIIDEMWNSNTGFIEPNKKLIARNARGILLLPTATKDKTFVNITGGITKISDTSNAVLRPLNHLFPISIDEIEIHPSMDAKLYCKKNIYTK